MAVRSISNCLRNLLPIFHRKIYQFTLPLTVCEGSLFPTSSPILVSCLFDNSHLNRYEVVAHYGFDLHFPDY